MAWAAIVAAAIQGTGALTSGVTAYQQSRANARTLRNYGRAEYRERHREATALLGKQRVAFAKSGIDPNTAGAVDVGAYTAATEELAARRIRNAYQQAARRQKLEGTAALVGGLLGGSAIGLGAASKYGAFQGQQAGGTGGKP